MGADILTGNAFDLALFLFPEEIDARPTAEIDAAYQERPGGLDVAARTARLEALARERLSLLRTEEELIRAAEDTGIAIERRDAAEPAFVLARDLARVTVADLQPL